MGSAKKPYNLISALLRSILLSMIISDVLLKVAYFDLCFKFIL
jgi:hypothetical protein